MTRTIGKPIPRIDALGKVAGKTPYSGDLSREGMLHMKVLFSKYAHARVVQIDTSEAEKVPGVAAIFTAKDVPVKFRYGHNLRPAVGPLK